MRNCYDLGFWDFVFGISGKGYGLGFCVWAFVFELLCLGFGLRVMACAFVFGLLGKD